LENFGGVSKLEKKYEYLNVERSSALNTWRMKKRVKLNWKKKEKKKQSMVKQHNILFTKKKIKTKKKKKMLTKFFALLD